MLLTEPPNRAFFSFFLPCVIKSLFLNKKNLIKMKLLSEKEKKNITVTRTSSHKPTKSTRKQKTRRNQKTLGKTKKLGIEVSEGREKT